MIKLSKSFYIPISSIDCMWDYSIPTNEIKDFVKTQKEINQQSVINLTGRNKLKTVVLTKNGKVILSPVNILTLVNRCNNGTKPDSIDD